MVDFTDLEQIKGPRQLEILPLLISLHDSVFSVTVELQT